MVLIAEHSENPQLLSIILNLLWIPELLCNSVAAEELQQRDASWLQDLDKVVFVENHGDIVECLHDLGTCLLIRFQVVHGD